MKKNLSAVKISWSWWCWVYKNKRYRKFIQSVNGFEWMEELSEFDERFIQSYDKNNDKGSILEVDVEYQNRLFNLHSDLPFLPERKKFENAKSLFVTYIIWKTMLYT